jgi:hypothetical protein
MKTALWCLLVGGIALAAGPETRGTAASVAGLQINGAAVPVAGTKTWPVMAGDEIKSPAAPVLLTLKDGSKILLAPNSVAKFETTANGRESFRLVNGSMNYEMSSAARTQLVVNNQPLVVTPGAAGAVGAGAIRIPGGSVPDPGYRAPTAKVSAVSVGGGKPPAPPPGRPPITIPN